MNQADNLFVRTRLRLPSAALAFYLAIAGALAQEAPSLSIERKSTWRSSYIWRGLVLESKSIFESDTTMGFGNAWLNVWTYNRGIETLAHRSAREVDVSLGWDFEAGGWLLSPSVTLYTYPNGWEPTGTTEWALSASRPVGGGFAVFANAYVDAGSDSGASFLEFGGSWTREFGHGWTLWALANLGRGDKKFNASNYEEACTAWNAVEGNLGLDRSLGANASLSVSFGHSRTLDRRLRRAPERPDASYWIVELTISR